MDTLGAYEELRAGEQPAGFIVSFDPGSGRLVLELANGGRIVGIVTSQTWIEDGDETHHARRQLRKWYRLNDVKHDDDLDGWHRGPTGAVTDLRAGAVVEDAVVVLRDGRALFGKLELSG